MATTVTPSATFPVAAAGDFNVTPSYSGTFIPVIWSGKLLEKFYASSTFAACANTNWEGELKGKGDTVIIHSVPTLTIRNYEAGMNLDYEVPVADTQELHIDQGRYFAFQVNDVLKYQSDYNLMDMFSSDAAEQLKINVDSDCWLATFDGSHAANKGANAGAISGMYNLGTDAAPVTLDSDNILETILAMASVMDEQNVPEEGRFLVLTPRERFLLMQSNLAQAYYTGDSTSPLRNGKLGRIDRFDLYVSNLLPKAAANKDWDGGTDNGTAARHALVAGHKTAITFAGQITKSEQLRNPNDFGDVVRSLKVYGRKVVKPESLVTLVAAS